MAKTKKSASGHKYFADQLDDEDVLFVFRKHPVVMRKGLIFASFGMLVGPLYTMLLTVVYSHHPEKIPSIKFFFVSVLLSFLLAAIIMLPSWIGWFYSVFIVTDQRFIQITQKGLFHRSLVDIGLSQIQMVNYEVAGLQQTMLGFGTIMMQTYMGDLVVHEVHHPAKIQKRLLAVLREYGDVSSPYAGANANSSDS